jgi:hypothetical protein
VALARADLYTYLDGQFAALAQATLPAFATPAALYDPAIDQALRALGVAQSALPTAAVADDQTPDALALAEYYSLLRFARALTQQVDLQAQAPRLAKKRSQFFDHVHTLLEDARAELVGRGYLGQGWDIQRLELDFLEPAQDF